MTKTPGIINVVSDLNLPSDGVTDCYSILQTALNNSQPGTCVVFPQMGSYAFSQPLIVDRTIYMVSSCFSWIGNAQANCRTHQSCLLFRTQTE